MLDKLAPYAKAVVAILGTVLTTVMTQFPNNAGVQQWGPIVASLLTAIAVYLVPNAPKGETEDSPEGTEGLE